MPKMGGSLWDVAKMMLDQDKVNMNLVHEDSS